MCFNKKTIKIISFTLIILTIFTFSVVLAADDSIYVWSTETEPLSTETSAKTKSTIQNDIQTNTVEDNANKADTMTNSTKENKSAQTSAEEISNSTDLALESGGAILIEQKTGQVLYEHNMHDQLRPASVTKIMSILLIMEALDSGQIELTDKVPCTEQEWEVHKFGLK